MKIYTCMQIDNKIYREDERLIEDEKADYVKSCRRQILASLLASLMSFSSGTVIAGWTATIYEDDDLTSWSTEQESWIISIYVFGALIGALPAGFFSRKFGRKIFLLWLALPMTVGWIICLMQLSNMTLECVGRFLCGLSLGATTVAVPLYASDVSSDVLRGRTGVFLDFMLCAGIQYAYVFRTLMGLRHFCIVCAIVPLIFVLLFSYMPESPVHLFNKGRYNEAITSLIWLRGKRVNIKSEFQKIERSQWKDNEQLNHGKMSSANKKYLVKVLIVSFGLVLVQRLSGAGGVIQYSTLLFKKSGNSIDPNVSCIILGTFQLIASGASFLLIDKVGRRTLLLISSAVVTTCLLLLVIYCYFSERGDLLRSPWKISVICILCVFISAFRLGLGPIPWFISTELMPAEYCDRIQSIVVSFSWILSFVIMKTFKIFVENYPVIVWSSFTIFSIVGFMFIMIYVPETNNKSREQIRLEFCAN